MTKNYFVLYKGRILYFTSSLYNACKFVINYAAENKWNFWKQETFLGNIHYTYYDKDNNYYCLNIIKKLRKEFNNEAN